MKIIFFARTLESTSLSKISQESSLLSNSGSLPKIRNARFGCCGALGIKFKNCANAILNLTNSWMTIIVIPWIPLKDEAFFWAKLPQNSTFLV